MKKILIKNIDKLFTVSNNSKLKKGLDMKKLPFIENAWIIINDDLIFDFGHMNDWKGIDNWNEFEIKHPDIFKGMYQFWLRKK